MTEIQADDLIIAAAAPAGSDAPRKNAWQRFEPTVLGTGTIVLLLLVWQFLPDFVPMKAGTKLFFTVPSHIAAKLWDMFATGSIWAPLGVSASAFAIGLLLAVVAGLPLGVLLGRSATLNAMIDPFITAFNATPRLVFLPLLMLWFGIGIWSKVAVVFLGAVIPIVISALSGVKTNEARFLTMARSFSASRSKIFASIILPGTVPFIFTGLKYAAGRALLGVVVGELYASTAGLGHMIAEAGNMFQTDTLFFGVLIFTATGLVVVALLDRLERRFERWRPSVGAAT